MQWTRIEDNWAAFIDPILQNWPDANEEDVINLDGDRAAFVDYIARVEQVEHPEAEEQVAEWQQGSIPADVRMDADMDAAAFEESGQHLMTGEEPSDDDKAFGDDNKTDRPIGRREE